MDGYLWGGGVKEASPLKRRANHPKSRSRQLQLQLPSAEADIAKIWGVGFAKTSGGAKGGVRKKMEQTTAERAPS